MDPRTLLIVGVIGLAFWMGDKTVHAVKKVDRAVCHAVTLGHKCKKAKPMGLIIYDGFPTIPKDAQMRYWDTPDPKAWDLEPIDKLEPVKSATTRAWVIEDVGQFQRRTRAPLYVPSCILNIDNEDMLGCIVAQTR